MRNLRSARSVFVSMSLRQMISLLGIEMPSSRCILKTISAGRAARPRQPTATETAFPPKNEWRYDNSPLGTNDFRSTKRNINWGYIGLDKGPGVGIESNGRQALRAMIDGERNTVFVNDFYGGIGSRWEWLANYGSGQKIAKGEKGKVLARIRLIEK